MVNFFFRFFLYKSFKFTFPIKHRIFISIKILNGKLFLLGQKFKLLVRARCLVRYGSRLKTLTKNFRFLIRRGKLFFRNKRITDKTTKTHKQTLSGISLYEALTIIISKLIDLLQFSKNKFHFDRKINQGACFVYQVLVVTSRIYLIWAHLRESSFNLKHFYI